MNDVRTIVRHQLAALAYRTQRTLQAAPAGFEGFQAGAGARTPQELLHHMSHLMNFTAGLWTGTPATPLEAEGSFRGEVDRFHAQLARLSDIFATGPVPEPTLVLRVVQGPLADAMTHVGQLAMLGAWRAHQCPVRATTRRLSIRPTSVRTSRRRPGRCVIAVGAAPVVPDVVRTSRSADRIVPSLPGGRTTSCRPRSVVRPQFETQRPRPATPLPGGRALVCHMSTRAGEDRRRCCANRDVSLSTGPATTWRVSCTHPAACGMVSSRLIGPDPGGSDDDTPRATNFDYGNHILARAAGRMRQQESHGADRDAGDGNLYRHPDAQGARVSHVQRQLRRRIQRCQRDRLASGDGGRWFGAPDHGGRRVRNRQRRGLHPGGGPDECHRAVPTSSCLPTAARFLPGRTALPSSTTPMPRR